ncbi:MAG: four helix bundle protein [Caldilineaceae bacterium]
MAGNLGGVASYRELLVYQKVRALALEIFQATKGFPKEEMYALTDQVRRSSRSIGAQIAEAWAKRRYERHFVSKLSDADGELQETQHWIGIAFDCGYWDRPTATALRTQCEEIGRLLGGMIEKADQFCTTNTKSLREVPVEYIASQLPVDSEQ